MPALPAAAATLQVRLRGTIGASAVYNNVFHVKYNGAAPTNAQLATFASAVGNTWNTQLAPLVPTTSALTGVDVTDLTSPQAGQASVTLSHPGTRVGTSPSAQVTMVGSWQAQLRFRGGHFRQYWPFGVITDENTSTTWTTAFTTAAQAALENFRTGINALSVGTATCQMGGLSYFTAHALRPTPLFVAFDSVAVHNRIDTQRRRLGKEART